MNARVPRRAAAALALALAAAQPACTTAPATGETVFTGGMSGDKAKKLGAREHDKILKKFGGPYKEGNLEGYIQDLGQELAAKSEEPEKDWTFTLLDTPMVNAFALPGGYIYVTRGLVAVAQSEAQLAGVIGHEIGHVTARHSAARYGSGLVAKGAGLAAGILLGRGGARAASILGSVAMSAYSREQEFEADKLGVRYATRAGYDADGMAKLLENMGAHSKLQAELRGEEHSEEFNLLATHPRTPKRVREAAAEAKTKQPETPVVGREAYLDAVDGMLFGHGPDQGFTRGRDFLHPELRLAFTVPEGFRLFNSARQVVARNPESGTIIFDAPGKDASTDPMRHLRAEWTRGTRLADVERMTINGMRAASGALRIDTKGGPQAVRLVVIRYDADRIYRFAFLAPMDRAETLMAAYERSARSFRKLSAADAAELEPKRLTVHPVSAGAAVATLAERMAFEELKPQRFRVLNSLAERAARYPHARVKLVTQPAKTP